MKPAAFRYHVPRTLEAALRLLDDLGPDAKLLAGGQSLVPLMNFRLARPANLIDLNRLDELDGIDVRTGKVHIKAMTRQRTLETSPILSRRIPIVPEAVRHIGHVQIRNRGTIGGSIAHNDPSAELPLLATTLGATIVVSNLTGSRTLSPEDFFLTYMMTTLGPTEMVTAVEFPLPKEGTGWAFREVARRSGDFALVAAASLITTRDGLCREVRLGLGGVGGVPQRVPEAEACCLGRALDRSLARKAAGIAGEVIHPDSDVHASADFRRRLAIVAVESALMQSFRRSVDGREAV